MLKTDCLETERLDMERQETEKLETLSGDEKVWHGKL